ncbi:MAG: hypothetical protein HRT89_04045 [Lentisphaeria bacterium]|nr:hypothetical protein [Lentisphaeria bacterium]
MIKIVLYFSLLGLLSAEVLTVEALWQTLDKSNPAEQTNIYIDLFKQKLFLIKKDPKSEWTELEIELLDKFCSLEVLRELFYRIEDSKDSYRNSPKMKSTRGRKNDLILLNDYSHTVHELIRHRRLQLFRKGKLHYPIDVIIKKLKKAKLDKEKITLIIEYENNAKKAIDTWNTSRKTARFPAFISKELVDSYFNLPRIELINSILVNLKLKDDKLHTKRSEIAKLFNHRIKYIKILSLNPHPDIGGGTMGFKYKYSFPINIHGWIVRKVNIDEQKKVEKYLKKYLTLVNNDKMIELVRDYILLNASQRKGLKKKRLRDRKIKNISKVHKGTFKDIVENILNSQNWFVYPEQGIYLLFPSLKDIYANDHKLDLHGRYLRIHTKLVKDKMLMTDFHINNQGGFVPVDIEILGLK